MDGGRTPTPHQVRGPARRQGSPKGSYGVWFDMTSAMAAASDGRATVNSLNNNWGIQMLAIPINPFERWANQSRFAKRFDQECHVDHRTNTQPAALRQPTHDASRMLPRRHRQDRCWQV